MDVFTRGQQQHEGHFMEIFLFGHQYKKTKSESQRLGEQDKTVFALLEGDISWKGGIKDRDIKEIKRGE